MAAAAAAAVPSLTLTLPSPTSLDLARTPPAAARSIVLGSGLRIRETRQAGFGSLLFVNSGRRDHYLCVKAAQGPPGLTQERDVKKMETAAKSENVFDEMKQRFLQFKTEKYLGEPERYENLAQAQAPKFLVIACADSRVCPSTILGFQPGDAFIVRNVANLVPPVENGPSETKAALEFSVNTLQVQNILVVGHSCCGGIRALMGMDDDKVDSSSFIHSWVITGKNARLSTKCVASSLSFDQQCRHCEKESINRSLINLMGYPWIKEKVDGGSLCLHGGYYNFVDCTFEKWTLDCDDNLMGKAAGDGYSIKNREFWS
uniref:Carbonic anhydrase n=1 Tax=Kalanchoe fedtschenkoi TaxID=63787 RepID=A0A7N0UQE6_KALFE